MIGYWPSPEAWRSILGPRLTDDLIDDAKQIIQTGRQHKMQQPREDKHEQQ